MTDLDSMLKNCTPTQRKYAKRHYVHGESITQIAERYGRTPSTVSITLKRVKKNVKKRLKFLKNVKKTSNIYP